MFRNLVVLIILFKTYGNTIADKTYEGNNLSPVVQTKCGLVEGVKNKAFSFIGIPFAEPPVKNLRWKRPIPKSAWKGTFKATEYGNTCAQTDIFDRSKVVGSEDCLYLNVWTPTLNKNARLPVMVYIHGGYLEFLNGNWPTYMPSEELSMETNMVYVSMNYRLNAFGFMALDILSENSETGTSGNYGFMDQILALQWVNANIKNFGGDPNWVTVFGQSSGGTSIYALLASVLAKGLFHRAWMISGSPKLDITTEQASKDNLVFLKATGCSTYKCLMNLPMESILKAIPWDVYPYWAMADQLDLPIYNLFDGGLAVVDGYVLKYNPMEAWSRGIKVDVPVIIGTTAQEIDFMPAPKGIENWSWETYEQKVREKMEKFPGICLKHIFNLYPKGHISPEYQYTSMVSDMRVTCPTNDVAYAIAQYFKSPVYRYVATAWPSVPVNLLGFPFSARYAAHLWDFFAFLDTIKDYYPPLSKDNDFKNVMRQEIIEFARNGTPFTKTWRPFPEVTADISSELKVVDFYNFKQCSYWKQAGLFVYAWVN